VPDGYIPGMGRATLVLGVLVAGALTGSAPALAAGDKPGRPTDRRRAEAALNRADDLLAGRGVRSGREVTLALARLAGRKDALSASDRRRAGALLARPTNGASDPAGDGYTVTEATPYCRSGGKFCIHYVTSTEDAPPLADTSPANGVPDYVETMASEFEFVYSVENGRLGWVAPKSDGTRGGNGRTDVYIKQIGNRGIFGYAAPEQNSVSSYAYLVMDDDYSEFGFANPIDALRVTAAHEYNHVLQFTYDRFEDVWMFESTAVWMEDLVYPAINDYLGFVDSWAGCTDAPLTAAAPGGACNSKIYGSAVWNHWIDARYGADAVRRAWELADTTSPTPHFAPDAYDESVKAEGGAGFGDEFGVLSAAVAEWRAPASPFPDHASYPDAARTGSLTVGGTPLAVGLDHTTFKLVDVTGTAGHTGIELYADAPAGLDAALALVGRTGADPAAGATTTVLQRLPGGGSGGVSLPNPGGYGRITAVLVNADASQSGFAGQDWVWTRDDQVFQNVRVVSQGTAPGGAPAALARARLIARLRVASPQRLAAALGRGVLARVRCNQACRVRVELLLDRATVRRLGLRRVVGSRVAVLTRAGIRSLRVKLSRRARGRLGGRRAVRLTARMRASRGTARAALVSRRLTLRR
jgi:hypothetical protein